MRKLIWNKRGGVSMLFALSMLPTMFAVGAAVDFTRLNRVKSELQSIADASAIAAVTDPDNSRSPEDLERTARAIFLENSNLNLQASDIKFEVDVTIDRQTSERVASVRFATALPTTFMMIAGIEDMHVGGFATASSGLPPDTDFYFLLDTSDSMGLAATQPAREKLIDLSIKNGTGSCEFACHVKRGGKDSLLSVARKAKLKLRLDVARDGIADIVDLAAEAALKDHVENRFALTSFNSKLATISDLTASASTFKSKVAGVELGHGAGSTANADTLWETTTPKYITELKRITQAGGRPEADKVVVLITDGLRSQDGGSGKDAQGRPRIRPVDLNQCEAIKKAGYKLAVVYTMYYDIPYNAWYNTYVKPIRGQLQTNLEACATKGMFAVGDTPEEIDRAFKNIFKSTRANPHITS